MLPLQVAGGGVAQTVSVEAYVQAPLAHVPVAAYVRRVVGVEHVVWFGMLQMRAAHGSPMQALPVHPLAHAVSVAV
jgi:hypothetical protein